MSGKAGRTETSESGNVEVFKDKNKEGEKGEGKR